MNLRIRESVNLELLKLVVVLDTKRRSDAQYILPWPLASTENLDDVASAGDDVLILYDILHLQ